MERKPILILLFFTEESIKINIKYKNKGIKKNIEIKMESITENNTKKTKIVGNQNVIFAASGCHLFKIGLTSPNFLTCIENFSQEIRLLW